MYTKKELNRLFPFTDRKKDHRSPFRVDYARLIHSPAFRRLQGKTQLFPSNENDYFRNRLTHSLEVAQIAKSIALKLNTESLSKKNQLDLDLVEFAALAHDLGHPPFGHQGEEALDNKMIEYGGFEGNAQTLRLLTRIEKKYKPEKYPNVFEKNRDLRIGLNLTPRTLASILKYDNVIPETKAGREAYRIANGHSRIQPVKGYYATEKDLVNYVKEKVLNGKAVKNFKTIECQIMDVSDDIAYSTYDLDDTLKSGFYKIYDILFPGKELLEAVKNDLIDSYKNITIEEISNTLLDIFNGVLWIPDIDLKKLNNDNYKNIYRWLARTNYNASVQLVEDSFNRNAFTSSLVNEFVNGIVYTANRKVSLSKVELREDIRFKVEVLKKFNYQLNILSPRLKIVAHRGKEVIDKIFDTLIDESIHGYQLLPKDFQDLYNNAPNKKIKYRVICDFIAGMTDRYCIEFYGRLTSENPETIFKPF